ncbi:MAG: LacI family transcriptional regulator [Actinobacteria bacterium]|nr:MAG: LacI family transcriptional regulator [Actinomycetota bacterium]
MARDHRISIKDVAREADVSVTTVSHALNDKGRLNPDTRQRVRDVAKRLGYKPNPAARSLVSGKTGLIAVIPSLPKQTRVSFSDLGYFTELIGAATDVAVSRDRALVIAPPHSSDLVWDRVPLDGVIVIDPFVGDTALPVLRERGIPFVTVSADPDHPGEDATVECEDRESTRSVFDHFVERGARRVGFLSMPPMTAFLRSSAEAYASWCAANGQESLAEVIDPAEMDRRGLRPLGGRRRRGASRDARHAARHPRRRTARDHPRPRTGPDRQPTDHDDRVGLPGGRAARRVAPDRPRRGGALGAASGGHPRAPCGSGLDRPVSSERRA